jgi:RNA polymerase sigma factor (sigma-70 family)
MERLPDDELLALTPRRPEAFAVFYRRHEQTLLGWLMRQTGDPELAADLSAETFAAALLGVRRFDAQRGPALAWTFGIAHHKLQRARERGRVEDRARRRLGLPPLVLEDEALERVARLGGEARVDALLAQLPHAQAEAIRARVIHEQPYGRIAKTVRCSESVIRQRVSRGLATLRAIVGDGHD